MNIRIIAVGKIKEKYLQMGIAEYLKRLSAYARVEIIEVPDEKAPEDMSPAEANIIKAREEEKILKQVKAGTFLIPLAIEGKQYTSEGLADYISGLALQGKSDITFVIGGSLGLGDKILRQGDGQISFSRMTFPHQLMRLILLEQVYRAFRIIKGEPYHK